jgi:hypothetical protein
MAAMNRRKIWGIIAFVVLVALLVVIRMLALYCTSCGCCYQ